MEAMGRGGNTSMVTNAAFTVLDVTKIPAKEGQARCPRCAGAVFQAESMPCRGKVRTASFTNIPPKQPGIYKPRDTSYDISLHCPSSCHYCLSLSMTAVFSPPVSVLLTSLYHPPHASGFPSVTTFTSLPTCCQLSITLLIQLSSSDTFFYQPFQKYLSFLDLFLFLQSLLYLPVDPMIIISVSGVFPPDITLYDPLHYMLTSLCHHRLHYITLHISCYHQFRIPVSVRTKASV